MRRMLTFAGLFLGLGTLCLHASDSRQGPGRAQIDNRSEGAMKVGQAAPDLSLHRLDAKTGKVDPNAPKVTLSTLWAKKPVVLLFGSYT